MSTLPEPPSPDPEATVEASSAVAWAGVSSMTVPFLADQPVRGRQLHRLGIAAAPVPYRRLAPGMLVPVVGEALARTDHVARVGRAVRQEQDLRAALDVLTAL